MDAVVDPDALTCLGFVPQGSTLYNAWTNCVCVSVTDDLVGKPLKVQKDGDSYVLGLDDSEVVAQAWTALRTERNARLAQSDWTALSDAHLSQDKKDAWFAYRQALRDLPDEVTITSPADLDAVEWPQINTPS
jgi:hypothetical protein